MKTLVNGMDEVRHWNHIASFGQAKLISNAAGRVRLLGGSPTDRAEAREWISLFFHDAILEQAPANFAPAPCRRRHRRPAPPQTFWSGCRTMARRLAMML